MKQYEKPKATMIKMGGGYDVIRTSANPDAAIIEDKHWDSLDSNK